MPNGIYDPKWLPCRTPQGVVRALAFTLDRKSPSHTGRVDDEQMVEILRTANGRFGSTLSYLVETATSLRNCGIRDRDIERLVDARPAQRPHGLTHAGGGQRAPRPAARSRRADSRSSLGVDVDQDPGIVELDAERRIAGDQPPRPFVAAERQQLRIELGSEADRMAALAAMLGVDHRMVVEQAGHRDQRRRLHQRHVARQDQPAGGMRPDARPRR